MNNQLEAGKISIDNISVEISTPPVWGDPGDVVLDIPGAEMFIPYFEYAGANFALARYNSSMAVPELFLTSSFSDRDLREEIWIEEDLMSGSKGADILLRDVHGNIYCVEVHPQWQDTRSLTFDDMIIEDLEGEIAVGDVTGDGYKDILHLVPNGSAMELYEGPFPLSKGKAVLMLPDVMENIASGFDLTGDGISEIVFWHNDGNQTQLMIYYGYTLAPMAILTDQYEIRGVHGGDLDANLADDLFLQHDRPGNGEIKVLLDREIDFDMDITFEGFSIYGTGDNNLTGDEKLLVKDLDGDQICDIILGYPDHRSGKGKVLVQYEPDTHNFDTTSGIVLQPDTEMTGISNGDNLGAGIYVNTDSDGDLLPDILLAEAGDLVYVEMPRNDPISSANKVYFSRGDLERISGELYSIINITCNGLGCDESMLEVLRANISVEGKDEGSWIFLEERYEDSSWFDGSILLALSSIPERSIGVELGDVVNVEVMGKEGKSITIIGVKGQDDPPFFIETPEIDTVMESDSVSMEFSAIDPEDAMIEWSIDILPDWLGISLVRWHNGIGRLFVEGGPGNDDVGWHNFTVIATAGNSSSEFDISILVENRPPYLHSIINEQHTRECDLFRISDLFGSNDIVTYGLTMTGPSSNPWLTIFENGTLMGIPANRDVGLWQVNLTVNDGNGGRAWMPFQVNVSNAAPDIVSPSITTWREGEFLELDFNSGYEGDGLTHYDLEFSTVPVEIDTETGKVTIANGTIINQGNFQIGVTVFDGNGEKTTGYLELDVLNLRPEILNFNELPTTFKAGEWVRMDLELNHPIYGEDGKWENIGRLDFSVESNTPNHFFRGGLLSIEVFPRNIDAGDHRIKLILSDWEEGAVSTYIWDITIEENSSYVDPSIEVKVLGRRGDDLYLDIEYSSMTEVRYVEISIREFSEEDFDHFDSFEIPFKNPVIIDISELTSYKIDIKVTMKDPYNRETEGVIEVQTDILKDPDGTEGTSMFTIVLIVIVVLILIVLGSLLFIERTSYVIQSSIFKGGDVKEEEVVKPIQDHPGITFTELMKELDVEKKDLLTTINHLEAKGMARSVNDGLRIRFYPMMGSFVDGPLALNRFQEKILEIMYRTKNLDIRELSDASGFPRKNLERELKMLMLKGSVEKNTDENGTVYNLTRKMKARMRRSKRS